MKHSIGTQLAAMFTGLMAVILSALLGGYIPCVTVGFLSNVINGFFNSFSTY